MIKLIKQQLCNNKTVIRQNIFGTYRFMGLSVNPTSDRSTFVLLYLHVESDPYREAFKLFLYHCTRILQSHKGINIQSVFIWSSHTANIRSAPQHEGPLCSSKSSDGVGGSGGKGFCPSMLIKFWWFSILLGAWGILFFFCFRALRMKKMAQLCRAPDLLRTINS